MNWDAELRFQKTRTRWLQDGDRNTKFFHAVIRERRRMNTITLQEANGEVINDPKIIAQHAATFFGNLFTASPYAMHESLFDEYPRAVTNEMNSRLTAIPELQEIWDAISHLSSDSAPGPDGFTGHFFRGCWQIIQSDMVEMIQGYFLGDYLSHNIMATSLTLIPKIAKPMNIADYRPISLANFASKVVSKILASRLAHVLPMVIDEQQSGFVQGRSIHESIALAQEMVGDLDRRTDGGNIIFKYDMSKAYDRVEWRFLLRAMQAMGFTTAFQDLVYRNICCVKYRVCVNGFYSSEFRSTRGVRQGDPLSPLLFIIVQQMLSYNLNRQQNGGVLRPYRMGRGITPISHLFYADDMLVFTNGKIRSLHYLRRLLNLYQESSGQEVNLQKSAFYASKRISQGRIIRIQRVSGCHAKKPPFKYLGAPIYKGRCKSIFFEEIIGKMAQKLEGWKSRFLSFGGKITLINSVLASLPLHIFSCMVVPQQIQIRLEGLMRSFLWSQQGQGRMQWVSWRKICRPKHESGLGNRSLSETVYGLHGKLAWKILSQETLWTRLLT